MSHLPTDISDSSYELTPPTEPAKAQLQKSPQALSVNSGYKLVFDNIDKNVKPRYMRSDSQTTSLHYVQVYAVKDRLDYSTLSGITSGKVNLHDILPTLEDYELMKNDFAVLISRMITAHLPFFREDFKYLVQKHIPHKYSTEMCKKSEVVSETPLCSSYTLTDHWDHT